MNVSKYFAACSDGVFTIQSELGLAASDMRSGRRLSFTVVHGESTFKSEVSVGDAVRLETESLDIGDKSKSFQRRVIRAEDDVIAFQSLFKCLLLNLVLRRAEPVPDEVRKAEE
jgi:acyl-CoA thioester hydrolase